MSSSVRFWLILLNLIAIVLSSKIEESQLVSYPNFDQNYLSNFAPWQIKILTSQWEDGFPNFPCTGWYVPCITPQGLPNGVNTYLQFTSKLANGVQPITDLEVYQQVTFPTTGRGNFSFYVSAFSDRVNGSNNLDCGYDFDFQITMNGTTYLELTRTSNYSNGFTFYEFPVESYDKTEETITMKFSFTYSWRYPSQCGIIISVTSMTIDYDSYIISDWYKPLLIYNIIAYIVFALIAFISICCIYAK